MLIFLTLLGLASAYVLPPVVVQDSGAAAYNDSFVRNKILPLASAAYSSNPQMCLTNVFGDGLLKRQINVKCSVITDDVCSGYTGVIPSEKVIVLGFRGTQGFLQLISEANESIFEAMMQWVGGGKVSKYFGDAFNNIWQSGMKDDYLNLAAKYPGYQVWITGHSLGGAMASLATSFIVGAGLQPSSNVKLVTYGQPRTGNHQFSQAHDATIDYAFRVTHWRDLVPHLPNENFEGYYHHQYEAFYKDQMKPTQYTLCQKDEDSKCSDGLLVTASVDDHLHYFGRDVSGWGESGCKQ